MKTQVYLCDCSEQKNHIFSTACLVLLSVLLFATCKMSDDDEEIPILIEGAENLGSGYDVFENYADVVKIKAAILDLAKLNAAGLIESKTVEKSVFSISSGKTLEEYSSSLSSSVNLSGSYMYFSGAIKTNFQQERYGYDSYSFATVKSLIQKTQIRLPVDLKAEDLKPYLMATASNNLNDVNISPEYIFNVYGTHCMTGIILGGRLDYSVSAKTSDLTVGKSIGVYAEASFSNNVLTVSGSTEMVSQSEYSTFMNSCQKTLHVYGGQSEYGQNIINEDDYEDWINSIDQNTVFCNFTEHGLVPVWEFCDDLTRKEELKTAFESWANERKIVVSPLPQMCILDVAVLYGKNAADPYLLNGREYHRLNADLNRDAGGSFIWIYYMLGYENDPTFTPVTEICTIDESDKETLAGLPGDGWVKLPNDLNHGAGGDFIYLAFRRKNKPTDKLLTGLRVEIKNIGNICSRFTDVKNNWYSVTQGYNGTTMQDLNEGAGGYFIYLYYTHDQLKSN